MSLRTIFLLTVAILLALFTVLNWPAFMVPAKLSLVFASVDAPLGLVLLAVMGVLAFLLLGYVAYFQSRVIIDARQSARELKAQRELADQAELSRFTELRAFLDARLQQVEAGGVAAQARTQERIVEVETELRSAVERAGNTLAAYIGEVDDRVQRRMAGGTDPSA